MLFRCWGFFWRWKLFLYKVCPQLLANPAPSLAEPHRRPPQKVEDCPLCPQFVFVAQQYNRGVTGQWCSRVNPCDSSSPLLSGCCTWAKVCTDLWEGLSPQKLASLLEGAGCSSVHSPAWHPSFWVISTECPYPQAPGTHIATGDPSQKSSCLHTFSSWASQVWKQRYDVLIARISNI